MIQRILHITLASLVLFSSTGLLVNQHFCKSELKHSALFAPAKSCHADGGDMPNCPFHTKDTGPEGCCDDHSAFLKHKQEQVSTDLYFPKAAVLMLAPLPVFALSLPAQNLDARSLHFLNHKPPLLLRDYRVLLQVFRL